MAEPQFLPNEKFYTMFNNLVISLPLSIWMLINNIWIKKEMEKVFGSYTHRYKRNYETRNMRW